MTTVEHGRRISALQILVIPITRHQQPQTRQHSASYQECIAYGHFRLKRERDMRIFVHKQTYCIDRLMSKCHLMDFVFAYLMYLNLTDVAATIPTLNAVNIIFICLKTRPVGPWTKTMSLKA